MRIRNLTLIFMQQYRGASDEKTRERRIEGPPLPSSPHGEATVRLASLDYHPSLPTWFFTLMFLSLASSAALALDPLAPQASTAWPPKAVPKQATGTVPDFTKKNELCLDCHKEILAVKTGRKKVSNPHVLHLNSKKIAYEGKNRDCLTCHEMVTPSATKAKKQEGWFAKGDVYHPNVMRFPPAVWKKVIVRGGEGKQFIPIEVLRQTDPHPFKPTLKDLVCVECHGPDSKIKTFYGAPQAAK